MFQDDSSASRYWSNSSIVRWSRECKANHFGSRLFIKLVISSFLLLVLGFAAFSWIFPYSSPTTRPAIDQSPIVNFTTNLISITSSSMTEESTKINNQQSTSTLPSTNVISQRDEHVERSNGDDDDDVLLTKKYVSRIDSSLTRWSFFFHLELWLTRSDLAFAGRANQFLHHIKFASLLR